MGGFAGFDTQAEVDGACAALGDILDALGFTRMAKDCRENDGNLTHYASLIVKEMRRRKLPQITQIETRLRALKLI